MNRFAAALQTWFATNSNHSLRTLAREAGAAASLLAQWRAGNRPITFSGLAKLLPALERLSDRPQALAIHVAYLVDETVAEYQHEIHIAAQPRPAASTDPVTALFQRWHEKAKNSASFAERCLALDSYFTGTPAAPEVITTERRPVRYGSSPGSQALKVAEEPRAEK